MVTIRIKLLAAATLAVALSGCGSVGTHYVENATGQPIPSHALADEVFLDGTGPTARRLARMQSPVIAERRYAEPESSVPTRAITRSRPTAIERADNVFNTTGSVPGTTGSRNAAAQSDTAKSFNEWLEEERRQDIRLRSIMNICRC
jgi:hypothetical protein